MYLSDAVEAWIQARVNFEGYSSKDALYADYRSFCGARAATPAMPFAQFCRQLADHGCSTSVRRIQGVGVICFEGIQVRGAAKVGRATV